MKRVIFFVMFLLNSVVSAQYISNVGVIDGATGNLVYTTVNPPPPGADPFTWSGFVTTSSGGGGYSGGYIPGYNPNTGTFMFGYMPGTVSYSTPVNYALSAAGTGIQVYGLKYSWEYYNQDYSRGTLTGNINLTSNTGQVLQNYNYNMPYTTNGWTKMSGTENFNTQYSTSSLGNLNVNFTGKDDRWWAGYYGPQIRDINVNLLYSVVPPPVPTDFPKWVKLTDENGEFTLTKEGVVRYGANGTYIYQIFQAGTYSCSNGAWGKDPLGGVYKECDLGTNTTTTTTTVPKTTTAETTTGVTLLEPTTTTVLDPVTTPITNTTTATVTDPVNTTTSTTNTTSQPSAVVNAVAAPAPSTPSTTTSNTTSSSSTQNSTKESNQSGGGNVGLALSVISKNSERDAAGGAIAQAAMSQAQTAASQSQQEAANIASSAVSNSLAANAVSVGGQQSGGPGIKLNSTNNSSTQLNVSNYNSISLTNSVSGPLNITNVASVQQNFDFNVTPISNQTSYSLSTFNNVVTNNTQTIETYSLVTPNMLTDRTNPITDIIEGKQNIPQNNTTITTGPTVNRNAQDNDVAGGVNINKMALAPTGYGDYLNFTMKDVAFYAPKEVYKNQRNVDNARALKQLMTDTKHKQMVEEQYRR